MGVYDSYRTETELEQGGVVLDFGDYSVKIARAGGANLRFARVFEALTKPFRRAIQNETLSEDKAKDIAYQSYAEAIVLGWTNMKGRDGKEIPFSKENVIALFRDLPEFFLTIQQEAQRISNFRREAQKDEAKN